MGFGLLTRVLRNVRFALLRCYTTHVYSLSSRLFVPSLSVLSDSAVPSHRLFLPIFFRFFLVPKAAWQQQFHPASHTLHRSPCFSHLTVPSSCGAAGPPKHDSQKKMDAKLKNRRGEANQRFQNVYNLNEGLQEATPRDAETANGEDEKEGEWGDLGAIGKEWSSASSSSGGSSREKGEGEDKEGGGVATR